jgi:hypothetical protein
MAMKQLSIRDLLFLFLLVALALGWWLDLRPVLARYQLSAINDAGGSHAFVLDTATGEVWKEPASGFYQPKQAGK